MGLRASGSRLGEALISSDSDLKSPVMPLQIKDLAEEAIILILGHLRAVDLVNVSEVSKTIFKKYHISRAVAFQLDNIYTTLSSPIKEKRILDITTSGQSGVLSVKLGPDFLFICEVKAILAALGSPAPISGKGFWISTTWVANAKKYYEALNLPEIRKSGKKNFPRKTSKIRQRRGSDALPPWPSVNADITCPHGELALTKGLRAKKRLLDNRSWTFLRKFYPHGPQYKSTCVMDCSRCLIEEDAAKMVASVKREAGLKSRRSEHLDGPLESLSARRSGVPSHLLAQKMISGTILYGVTLLIDFV